MFGKIGKDLNLNRDETMTSLDISPDIITAIATVIVALAALFGPWVAIRTFRSQKWWEMRVHAYSKIVEALYKAQNIHDKHIGHELGERNIPDEEWDSLNRQLRSAREEVQEFANVGMFMLSKRATICLRRYHVEVEKAYSIWKNSGDSMSHLDLLESEQEAAKSCLEEILEIAKADLKVKRWFKRGN